MSAAIGQTQPAAERERPAAARARGTTPTRAVVGALLRKELRVELRTLESVPAMSLFAVTTFVVFHFALNRNTVDGDLAAGILWVTLLFAAILGVNRLFVADADQGGFDGFLRALRAGDGHLLWRRYLGGRILGGSFVAGNLVFTSTLAEHTFAMRVTDGKILWQLPIGKYSPGIVTERHYFFTLNGIVMAWHARQSPQILALQRAKKRRAQKKSAQGRVTTAPKGRTP